MTDTETSHCACISLTLGTELASLFISEIWECWKIVWITQIPENTFFDNFECLV